MLSILYFNLTGASGFVPLKTSVVCIKHFHPTSVKYENLHGNLKIPLKRPQLQINAIPNLTNCFKRIRTDPHSYKRRATNISAN